MIIETLSLSARDPEVLAGFYGDTMGLAVRRTVNGVLEVQAGHTRLRFEPAAPDVAPAAPAYHFALNIPWAQFAEAKAWLGARVALARGPDGADEFDFPHWEARAVYFYDLAGNIVELIARRAITHGADGRFGPRALLGISEIGLATPDVRALVAHLRTDGLDVFRGSLGDDFAAVGAESGLFIVVSEGRPWFPDGRVKAGAWPVRAEVVGREGQRWTLAGPPYRLARAA